MMITNQNIPLPDNALDIYEIAEKYGLSIEQAVQKIKNEGWTFVGYNDWGQEAFKFEFDYSEMVRSE